MSFARHQTFYVRSGWFSKGLEALRQDPKIFSRKDAAIRLGIGKNMVLALKFWMIASGLAVKETRGSKLDITQFGRLVWEYDRFFQEPVTWWLIHYNIVSNREEATAWYFLFNELDDSAISQGEFVNKLGRYAEEQFNRPIAESSLRKDYDCIVATYGPTVHRGTPEDNMVCPLRNFGLLRVNERVIRKSPPQVEIPSEIVFFVLKQSVYGLHQNVSMIAEEPGNVGRVFNLSQSLIFEHLDKLREVGWLSFSRTAGLDSVALEPISEWELLESVFQRGNVVGEWQAS